ncbi:MAG: HIT family protein [Bacteroidia bacterium]|nr:HIT family protein [Bacteroidia bacterium]
MSSIFSKIISGEIPCHKVAENENCLAFLDLSPVAKGHVLVIPKMPVDYIFDMEDTALADLHIFAKQVAKAVKIVVPCKKVGMAVVGLEVPHAHIHLIPMNNIGDLNFASERIKMTSDELSELASQIASYI